MQKKTICLFTAHSPASGGGGAILRSLIRHMPELSIIWCYTGSKVNGYEQGYLGEGVMGGNMIKDVMSTFRMLNAFYHAGINEVVNKLLNIQCDSYWIVSHNEGLRVALELTKRQSDRPVHLTIHDDWGGALVPQSLRYRWFSAPANRLTINTLKAVSSFDVISRGMQKYYKELSGRQGEVCHRYIPAEDINVKPRKNGTTITVGHIGRLYKKSSLIDLINLLKQYYEPKGIKPVVKLWGCHLNYDSLPLDLRNYVSFYPTASEAEVIPLLADCDMLYAMYPRNKDLSIFAQTSLPTKLTSYLQAGRPVLAHCPQSSTLADYINTTGLGVVWDADDEKNGFEALVKMSSIDLTLYQFQKARELYFGENNLRVMRSYLTSDNTVSAH